MKKYFVLARSKADAMVPISVRQSSCFEKLVFLNFLYTSAFGGLVGLLLFWVIL